MRFTCAILFLCTATAGDLFASDAPDTLHKEAGQALERAVSFFRKNVSTEGGYLWRYSHDLSQREGEGTASDSTVWVQPPGTPAVGEAMLTAWRATDDDSYLKAARDAGLCLVRGQLQSGGWDYRIEFAPKDRARYAYRVDDGKSVLRNVSTLDDDTTQAALRLLMHLDAALKFQDQAIHEAAVYGLKSLVAAQYPNGAWPQRFSEPPDAGQFPVVKAGFPKSWSRTHPGVNYSAYYTFNDDSLADCIDVMFEAAQLYNEPAYRAAAERAGDFILLAQLPEPQPAWAQQYNSQMHPAWARKFEPPSVTGGESQGVLRTLLRLYAETGKQKYLEPIPRAIEYLRRSRLSDGRLARFYELKTNKPLYFTKKYELTYNDDDLPTHYGFKVSDSTETIEREYNRLKRLDPNSLPERKRIVRDKPSRPSTRLIDQTRAVIAALNEDGAWVEEGKLKAPEGEATRIIDSRTFIKNVTVLANYLAATRDQ